MLILAALYPVVRMFDGYVLVSFYQLLGILYGQCRYYSEVEREVIRLGQSVVMIIEILPTKWLPLDRSNAS
jgi:hypothetical protein